MYSQHGIQRTLVVEQLFSGIIYPVKCLVLVKQIDLVVFESFTYEYQKQRQDSFSYLSVQFWLIAVKRSKDTTKDTNDEYKPCLILV